MALDSRTKTMIVASITAAAMVVTSLVIWKQVFFGARATPETASVTQKPEQAQPGALAPQTAVPGQLSAPSGGAILAPVTQKQAPEASPAPKDGEKTLDQIFSERQPVAPQPPAPQGAVTPPSAQGAPLPATGQNLSLEPDQSPPVTPKVESPAEPAPVQPQYRPVEADSTASAANNPKPETAPDDPERAALESSLEKEALGLTKISKEKSPGKKSEPQAKGKKQEDKTAGGAAAPEAPKPAAASEPRVPSGSQAKAAQGSAWKGQGVFQTASVSASGDASTVRIKATAVPPTHQVVTMDSPARVIIDLPGRWEHDGPAEVVGAGIVRKVRIGKHADKLRIVLDLTVDSASKLSGKPVIEETGGGLTITVKK
ncbi:MAG: AMIN domain-containing protein [Desulfovibrionaceae bacterium]|nr:AMIN domain-containing protein [Desulfovibrionaceae bacterium]MBF0514276.1 AMIN domain-containing protein [Desulfovibrionaceae bacterium]